MSYGKTLEFHGREKLLSKHLEYLWVVPFAANAAQVIALKFGPKIWGQKTLCKFGFLFFFFGDFTGALTKAKAAGLN